MKALYLLIALFPGLAMANSDSKFAIGLGTPYGGFAGLKYSVKVNDDIFYAGAGLAHIDDSDVGVTLGWERALNEKHGFGFALRGRTVEGGNVYYPAGYFGLDEATRRKDGYEAALFGNYTYYFSGASQSGFLAGANVGKQYRKDNVRSYVRNGTFIGVHLGYQF
ncbi:hypothetical protein [Microbulbifer hydrolyticus]|uniref:Outer membrane beta-barrel protein n=1 Tax=Microbulbifer hydrolyticus TaxID=48074 RepID=A0A6P1TCR7_9GAMM|nr:hypothetical protein [Microbulbifer hydrolyticus]MBB5210022.1 hypothetical protein [Microbulbifer hydrolyticus]QHQ39453.1 hypothetical protein GTQ55_10985 [Microbulbifer hydrolyticus]